MGKKLARFQLVTLLPFIHSYFIGYLKDTDFLNLLRAYPVLCVVPISFYLTHKDSESHRKDDGVTPCLRISVV